MYAGARLVRVSGTSRSTGTSSDMLACEMASPSCIPSDVPIGCPYCNTNSPAGIDVVAKRLPAVMFPVTRIACPLDNSTTVSAAIGALATATLSAELTTIAQLLIDTTCKKSSVDNQNLPGDKTRGVGREKHRSAGQFLDATEAFHRCAQQKLLAACRAVQKCFVQWSPEDARRDCVHTHAILSPLDCQRFGQRSQRRLAG